jgi:hypothetical protein
MAVSNTIDSHLPQMNSKYAGERFGKPEMPAALAGSAKGVEESADASLYPQFHGLNAVLRTPPEAPVDSTGRKGLDEQLGAGRLGDRRDRRVFDAALGRNGVKAFPDIVSAPDDPHTVLCDNIVLDRRG